MKSLIFSTIAMSLSLSAWAGQTTPVPDVSPASNGYQVVINIPQQRLFLYHNGSLSKVYPVAVGKAHTQTILGEHTIGSKAYNPTWHIPKSIQKELNNGKTSVPPGPDNPLGPVFVRLGDPKLGLGIHGTNAPTSVPGIRSHGCVRMKSPDALEFAKRIETGSPATVSYELVALNVDDNNNLWLASFKDPYNKNNLKTETLKNSINAWAKANKKTVNASLVTQTLQNKTGKAVCLTCTDKKTTIKGDLVSIAWKNGGTALTASANKTHRTNNKPAPTKPERLTEGSEIDVDAGLERADVEKILKPIKATSVFDKPKPKKPKEPPTAPAIPSAEEFELKPLPIDPLSPN